MSGPSINIVTNTLGDGDWVIVELEGDEIYSGHSIGVCHLVDILDQCNGFESLNYYELTDEQIQDWPACLADSSVQPTRKLRL